MRSRITVFGGTFDPIHNGHLIVARDIAEARRLDRITLMPAGVPPHKAASQTAGEHRLAMCQRVADRDPLFDVSDLELGREGRSYTIDTVDALRERGCDVTLIIGTDMLEYLPHWHRSDELLGRASFLVAARPPLDERVDEIFRKLENVFAPHVVGRLRESIVETSRIEISSTQIRERRSAGKPISYLTPECVVDYIAENGLYAGNGPQSGSGETGKNILK
ncbi:MAG: nicotinate-nucleotide adenylyltransferase [Planctomycetota bacterium]